jgi:CheY-like chemotaxis protein
MSEPAVLIADDDSNDIFFLRRAFEKAGLNHLVLDVPDGEGAIHYLSGDENYSDRSRFPLPSLMFLDLKMPKVSGFEVLKWLNDQKRFPDLKVVVLSSSGLQSDIQQAKDLGAHEYRVKPADIDDMITMVKEVADRWLGDRPRAVV